MKNIWEKLNKKVVAAVAVVVIIAILLTVWLINNTNYSKSTNAISKTRLGTYKQIGNMVVPRHFHSATLLKNEEILLIGGKCGKQNWFQKKFFLDCEKSAEIFDLKTNTSTLVGEMNLPHFKHYAFLIPSGQVIIIDANRVEIFSPKTNSFTLGEKMIYQRKPGTYSAILLPNNKILIAGGYIEKENEEFFYPQEAEIYDINSGKFSLTGKMIKPRHNTSAILLPNNKVLFVGGFNFNEEKTNNNNINRYSSTPASEIYDIETAKFTSNMDIKEPLSGIVGIMPDGKIIIHSYTSYYLYDYKANTLVKLTKEFLSQSKNKQSYGLSEGKVFFPDYKTFTFWDKSLDAKNVLYKNYNDLSIKEIIFPWVPSNSTKVYLPERKVLITGGEYEPMSSILKHKIYKKVILFIPEN